MTLLTSELENESGDKFIEKLRTGKNPPDLYFEEEYKMLSQGLMGSKHNPYDQAKKLELRAAYDLDNLEPLEQLKLIETELVIRVKITALEAFKIGKLLLLAKRACRLGGFHFKVWLKDHFDPSYETANNYMNVYMNCLCMMSIAAKLPLSILVKISKPNFPDDLREYLFEQGNIESMTNIDLDNLIQKYKEGKFDEVKQCVDSWNKDYYVFRQTQFIKDHCNIILADMIDLSKKIRLKSKDDKTLLPEAKEVNEKLSKALDDSSRVLLNAVNEVEDILFNFDWDNERNLNM